MLYEEPKQNLPSCLIVRRFNKHVHFLKRIVNDSRVDCDGERVLESSEPPDHAPLESWPPCWPSPTRIDLVSVRASLAGADPTGLVHWPLE